MKSDASEIPCGLERTAELDRLGDEIALLSAHLEAATGRLLDLIREFDARAGWGNGFRSCAHWLSWRVGLDPGAARERVRVARALGTLPLLAEALARGELSYAKVRALTRVATPETEARLLAVGRRGRRPTSRGSCGAGGGWTARGGAGECAAARAPGASHPPRRGRHGGRPGTADAGGGGPAREGAGGSGRDAVPAKAQGERGCPFGRPDHESAAARSAAGGRPGAGGGDPRCTRARSRQPWGALPGGGTRRRCRCWRTRSSRGSRPWRTATHVSAETSQRLACDASRVVMSHDEAGRVMEIGARTRTIPPALRRALQQRDRGCRFPGCGVRVRAGASSPALGARWSRPRCRTSRSCVGGTTVLCTRTAIRSNASRTARFQFRRPDGRPLPEVPPAPALQGDPAEALRSRHEAARPEIHARTAIPGWHGERLDLVWAIDVLHPLATRARPG